MSIGRAKGKRDNLQYCRCGTGLLSHLIYFPFSLIQRSAQHSAHAVKLSGFVAVKFTHAHTRYAML